MAVLIALYSIYNSRSKGSGSGVTIASVTDGDTIRVNRNGAIERIRLIGIDTPETNGPGGLKECYGEEATQRTKELLPKNTKVELVFDSERYDKYGRTLAYVYRASDQMFVNLQLAREGYADELSIEPDTAHATEFAEAVEAAKHDNLGLWKACGSPDVRIS